MPWKLEVGGWKLTALVRQADPELHRAIGAVRVLHELRGRQLVLTNRPVRTVEDVEDVRDQIERAAPADVDLLLPPEVRAVLRRGDEPVARNHAARRAVGIARGTDALLVAGAAETDRIAARRDLVADARAQVVQTRQLEALVDLPDAVQHQAMALIVARQAPFAADARRDDRRLRQPAERLGRLVIQPRQRVGGRALPVLAEPLRQRGLQAAVFGFAEMRVHRHDAP